MFKFTVIFLSFILVNSALESQTLIPNKFQSDEKQTYKKWSLNIIFSDNGFGFGATLYRYVNKNFYGFGSIFFSGAKDDREFETMDIFGNTYTPEKVNRIIMIPIDIGIHLRLFKESLSDELQSYINIGLTPTTIVYTPYSRPFFSSLRYARTKYTVGTFAGAGIDYLTGKKSSLSFNVRYYYIKLFKEGIESIRAKEMRYFGGIFLVFSYNFMSRK